MMPIVASIPHTGTRTVYAGLLKSYKDRVDKLGGHIYAHELSQVRERDPETTILIVPLRHPHEVAKSWDRRGKPFTELLDLWSVLVEVVDAYGPIYIPVDDEVNRDRKLSQLNALLGASITTDWPKIGSIADHCHGSVTDEQKLQLQPFVEFYKRSSDG